MTDSELVRLFESGEIADDYARVNRLEELARKFENEIADEPDRSVEFETVEEWLAIADQVFRKKRLRELIAIKNAEVPEEESITINRGRD